MTREPGKSRSASIRARLLSLAQATGEDYQRVLGRFAIERFLYRLGASSHQDRFVLKGANLFTLWTGNPADTLWIPFEVSHILTASTPREAFSNNRYD